MSSHWSSLVLIGSRWFLLVSEDCRSELSPLCSSSDPPPVAESLQSHRETSSGRGRLHRRGGLVLRHLRSPQDGRLLPGGEGETASSSFSTAGPLMSHPDSILSSSSPSSSTSSSSCSSSLFPSQPRCVVSISGSHVQPVDGTVEDMFKFFHKSVAPPSLPSLGH